MNQKIGLAIVCGVILLAASIKSSFDKEPDPTPAPPMPVSRTLNRPPRALAAGVKMTDKGLLITNNDAIDFQNVTIKLNMNQNGSDDGRGDVGSIPVGKSVTIPYGDFLIGTTRFNRYEKVILTVYVKADAGSQLFICPGPICQPAPQ